MSEQGHYKVTVHRRRGWDQPLSRTFPFGQWAEIGFWLDEIGAGEHDSVAVTLHPLVQVAQDPSSGRWYVVDAQGARLHGPYNGQPVGSTVVEPPLPEGSVSCGACGAVTAWEGEPPVDCLACGATLDRWQKALGYPVEELELGVRAYNILKRQGVDTIGDFLAATTEAAMDLWDAHSDSSRRWGSQARRQVYEVRAGLTSMRLQIEADERIARELSGLDLDAAVAAAEAAGPLTPADRDEASIGLGDFDGGEGV